MIAAISSRSGIGQLMTVTCPREFGGNVARWCQDDNGLGAFASDAWKAARQVAQLALCDDASGRAEPGGKVAHNPDAALTCRVGSLCYCLQGRRLDRSSRASRNPSIPASDRKPWATSQVRAHIRRSRTLQIGIARRGLSSRVTIHRTALRARKSAATSVAIALDLVMIAPPSGGGPRLRRLRRSPVCVVATLASGSSRDLAAYLAAQA